MRSNIAYNSQVNSTVLNKTVIIYGPPGVGKSTLIKHARKYGYPAIDLEDYPESEWLRLIEEHQGYIIGAAGVHPSITFPFSHVKVLLYLNQKEYDRRRKVRDHSQPSKAAQPQHLIADWRSTPEYFDLQIYADSPQHDMKSYFKGIITRLKSAGVSITKADVSVTCRFFSNGVGGYRILYSYDDTHHVVFKFFGVNVPLNSIKFWFGEVDHVVGKWNMKEVIITDEAFKRTLMKEFKYYYDRVNGLCRHHSDLW